MTDIGRQFRSLRENSILPSNPLFIHLRIMIIVTILYYLIIKRMVHKIIPLVHQILILLFIFRKKSHIDIRRRHIYAVRLRRIKVSYRLGDIPYRIGVFQLFTQDNHLMGHDISRTLIFTDIIHSLFITRNGHKSHDRQHKFQNPFHGLFVYMVSAAKLPARIRFQKMNTDYLHFRHLLILQGGFINFVRSNFNIKICISVTKF